MRDNRDNKQNPVGGKRLAGRKDRVAGPPSSRRVAAEIVREVFENQTLFDEALVAHEGFVRLSPEDRRLAYHLAAGTIKYKRRLDFIARHYLQEKFDNLPKNIRAVLRVGLFQISVSDRIPLYAAVNETVKVARRLGHEGTARLVNAVLRRFAETDRSSAVAFPNREKRLRDFLATWYSYPDWLIDIFFELGGEVRAEEYCRWGNSEPIFYLRINSSRTSPTELIRAAKAEGVTLESVAAVPGYFRWISPRGPSSASQLLQSGLASVQNPAAGLVIQLLDPLPKETVLDLFAAPGGKSGAIAERQKDSGRVLAVDKSVRRLVKVNENKARLGLDSIIPISGDARSLSIHQVDRVLADVPCSALGTLPKNPDTRWQKTPADLDRLAAQQAEYLTSAARHVRPGGVLVYTTCTLAPQENQRVVKGFLEGNSDFALVSASDFVPPKFVDPDGFLVTYPPHSDLDCVFAARLRKVR